MYFRFIMLTIKNNPFRIPLGSSSKFFIGEGIRKFMLADLTNWLLEAIKTHGLLAVVLGVVIETVIVPLPSPVIVMAAGYILPDRLPAANRLY